MVPRSLGSYPSVEAPAAPERLNPQKTLPKNPIPSLPIISCLWRTIDLDEDLSKTQALTVRISELSRGGANAGRRRKTIRAFVNRGACETPRLGFGDFRAFPSGKPFVLKYGGMNQVWEGKDEVWKRYEALPQVFCYEI